MNNYASPGSERTISAAAAGKGGMRVGVAASESLGPGHARVAGTQEKAQIVAISGD
jgi:hypothetical protein